VEDVKPFTPKYNLSWEFNYLFSIVDTLL